MMIDIRELRTSETDIALDLVWRVFQKFEGPDYSEEGIETFRKSIYDPEWLKMLRIYGAFESGVLLGVLATRSGGSHVSLLFVDERHHRRGIGRMLMERAKADCGCGRMTVHSSPYAKEIYRRLGFAETAPEQVSDGIRFVPMEIML